MNLFHQIIPVITSKESTLLSCRSFSSATQILAISSLRNHSFTRFWVTRTSDKFWFWDFILIIFNQTLKHKDLCSKTSKVSPPNFLNQTLRWERHAMSEPFLWSIGVLGKEMAQTSPLYNSKTIDMILLMHKIKRHLVYVLTNAYRAWFEYLNPISIYLKYLL